MHIIRSNKRGRWKRDGQKGMTGGDEPKDRKTAYRWEKMKEKNDGKSSTYTLPINNNKKKIEKPVWNNGEPHWNTERSLVRRQLWRRRSSFRWCTAAGRRRRQSQTETQPRGLLTSHKENCVPSPLNIQQAVQTKRSHIRMRAKRQVPKKASNRKRQWRGVEGAHVLQNGINALQTTKKNWWRRVAHGPRKNDHTSSTVYNLFTLYTGLYASPTPRQL